MTVIYSNAIKNDRLQVVADAISAGDAPGVLQIGTAGMASVLAEIPLTDPPSVESQVLTLLSAPATEAALADGTAAEARLRDSDGNDCATGLTVGTSAADVVLDSLSFTTGQNVTINSATITHG